MHFCANVAMAIRWLSCVPSPSHLTRYHATQLYIATYPKPRGHLLIHCVTYTALTPDFIRETNIVAVEDAQ